MKRSKWVDRKFTFDLPEGWMTNVIERLSGTPVRMHHLVSNKPEELLSYQPDGSWSVKQHIGHLADLEDLHIDRIHQLVALQTVLSPADMSNKRTEDADHNQIDIHELIQSFTEKRNEFIGLLSSLTDEVQEHGALHERLNTKMRPIDVGFFTAEHDDHHLAYVSEILNS